MTGRFDYRAFIEGAGYAYPANWSEMSGSAKDSWEEAMVRSIRRARRRREIPS